MKDLKLIDNSADSKSFSLAELREKLQTHPAFNGTNTHLEKLALKYGVKIIWVPKYHCELNPIEGFWCYLKRYVRENNDQNFNKLDDLILEAISKYKTSDLKIKLWFRFWRALEMYANGLSYQEVLQELFGAKSST
jgi:transposase